ncbi:MAG: N-acetylmuramoyl-L-alanine amidase [Tumebacillaceae bacterium]
MMSKQIICIDPGHGGYDPGAVASGAREKDITLQIGLQLRDLLQRAGLQVVMTRERDQSPGGYTKVNADLRERCRIANDAGVDTFLSIHVNAGGGTGAEIYVSGDGGRIAGLANGIIRNVSSICGTHGQAVRDGGPSGAGWAVIRNTVADAMLVEIGFIDSDDLSKIQAHLHEFAPLIARAFCDFYGVPFPEQSQPVLDKDGANLVISQLGALTKTVTPDVLVACNYAANALRRGISAPINEDHGAPSSQAAATLLDLLGSLWKSTARREVQDAYHFAADALRGV